MPRLGHRRSAGRTLLVPVLVAVATAVALVAGLFGEGLMDWIAWAGLALPIVLALRRP